MKKRKAFDQRGDMAIAAWAEQQQLELNLRARRLARSKVVFLYLPFPSNCNFLVLQIIISFKATSCISKYNNICKEYFNILLQK